MKSNSPLRALSLAVAATVGYMLPPALVGAMAVQISDDLQFGATGIGLAVGLFHGSAVLTATRLGHQVDRIGAINGLRLAMLATGTAGCGIAWLAPGLGLLLLWMMVGGLAFGLGQAASNRLLSLSIPYSRQGIAFGLKQAAAPAATSIAGVSVPLIALQLGWRWAFFILSLHAGATILLAGPAGTKTAARTSGPRLPLQNRHSLVLLGIGFAFATAASASLMSFYVDSAVASGETVESAAMMLALASGVTIVVRLLAGFASDRLQSGHLIMCAAMLSVGGGGYLLIASDGRLAARVGLFIAMGFGWGMNGVFWFAVVRAYARQPGAITGALMPGTLLGGAVGPISLGLVADSYSYQVSWTIAALFSLLAAFFIWRGSLAL